MNSRRVIEIYSAGCPVCRETVADIKRNSRSSCKIRVLDMRKKSVATRGKNLGIRSVPAVVIDGKLADCCAGRGVDLSTL